MMTDMMIYEENDITDMMIYEENDICNVTQNTFLRATEGCTQKI